MIFIDIFCCALNGKYSALYIKGRRTREGEGGKEEERRRKGGRGRREYQACVPRSRPLPDFMAIFLHNCDIKSE